jgi:CRISPR-associated protein Cmr4
MSQSLPDLVNRIPAKAREPQGRAGVQDPLQARAAVLSDEDFLFLVRHRLPVVARVKLTAGKTTGRWRPAGGAPEQEGHLWAEETVPPDSLFYAPLSEVPGARARRTPPNREPARQSLAGVDGPVELVAEVLRHTRGVLQLGGDETVGLGWCWAEVK